MIAEYTNSYLKQAHTKKVEKIGVSRYKLLLNFNNSAWNINKHCDDIWKIARHSHVQNYEQNWENFKILPCVSAVSKSLCLYV
jgi:hypothetical protein